MYVVHAYQCPACGRTEDRLVRSDEVDAQWCRAFHTPEQHAEGGNLPYPPSMKRLVSATRTTFRYADDRLKR